VRQLSVTFRRHPSLRQIDVEGLARPRCLLVLAAEKQGQKLLSSLFFFGKKLNIFLKRRGAEFTSTFESLVAVAHFIYPAGCE
jgi:hypothetical protein